MSLSCHAARAYGFLVRHTPQPLVFRAAAVRRGYLCNWVTAEYKPFTATESIALQLRVSKVLK
jgi:hypothetical protein